MMYPSAFYSIAHGLARSIAESLFHLKVINRDKLIEQGSCIYVVNHQSFLDPPMVGQLISAEVHFLARKTLMDIPCLKWALPHCNTILIDQEKPGPGSILRVLRLVRGGGRIVIFPEGARSEDGEIHDAMPGIGLIISRMGNVPVQPIRIEGAYDCLPIHSSKLRFKPITLSVGDPIRFTPQELKAKTREEQLALGHKIMDAIRALPVGC